jgi:two-component system sensor histidine kinase KdpD
VQTITVDLTGDLPLLRADATLAEQAIGNVVANALVHTRTETAIVIDAVVTVGEVAVRVTDNGPGIASDALPHIFDKFAKGPELSMTRADGSQSTGLGLAIAKGIMEAHGGSIGIETPVANGHGARFTMTFPREQGTP